MKLNKWYVSYDDILWCYFWKDLGGVYEGVVSGMHHTSGGFIELHTIKPLELKNAGLKLVKKDDLYSQEEMSHILLTKIFNHPDTVSIL